ncbi:endonuclease III [Candidatus Saccharibacteria bacterium QS_5_54_17]|nr:MAG: endonuclease III [Candidatus Saccharibacteria bacterium QS_5_54_17]
MSRIMTDQQCRDFQAEVWQAYADWGRDLPWRTEVADPYAILVSEIMLQQTQVSRVITKFQEFLSHFPTMQCLADAPQMEVLRVWQGLGYNRRARFLHQTAQIVSYEYGGTLPASQDELRRLPGIGPNTAGSIATFVYNQPTVFIETNIRTVFLHRFFSGSHSVADSQILPIIADTLDQTNPRQWYWALMDYGAHIKQTVGNVSRRSQHYVPQSPFQGSRRQVRGKVVRLLAESRHTYAQLHARVSDPRLVDVLADLEKERLIARQGKYYLSS